MILRKNYGAAGIVAAGSTRSLGPLDAEKVIRFDTLTGSIVTLPASRGDGKRYHFLVGTLATSNSHIVKVANATDVMRGIIMGTRVDVGNAVLGFAAGATDDTVTLNRTTTGSVSLGEWLEFFDYAAGFWHVRGMLSATGAAFATPFSATV
jgi:hypothetical protein